MLQRLSIALVQVIASNNSENLLNKIWQTVYSLYPSKKLTNKVYNNNNNNNNNIIIIKSYKNRYYIYDLRK